MKITTSTTGYAPEKNLYRFLWLSITLLFLNIGVGWGQTTIFAENMGTPSGTSTIANNVFQNSGLSFTGTGDVRSTTISNAYSGASGGGNIFITSISGINFQIGNINTSNYTNLSLSFGVYKSTTASSGSDLIVEYSTDGTNYSGLTFPALSTGTGTSIWFLRTTSGELPSTTNLRIRFRQNGTTTQFRIDDVVLKGTLNSSPPTKLAITSITPTTPTAGSTFNVTVQAQDNSNNAGNVTDATAITLANTGGGTIGGTTTGTIAAGTNSVTITGVTLSSAGTGVTLTASRTNGDVLTDGTSAAFNVLATAPTTISSAIVFGAQTTTSIPLSWTIGNGTNRIVVRRTGGSATTPVNGTDYSLNSTLGSGTVIYNGNSNDVTATGLSAGTQYTFDIYEYNGSGTTANYGSAYSINQYTLSSEPTAHPATLTATNIAATTLTLNFTTSSTTLGYLIVRKNGDSPFMGTPIDGTGYTVGSTIGDGTVAAVITSTTTSSSITGLSAATQYTISIIPFGRVTTNTETYNYYTDGTIRTLTTQTLATLPTAATNLTIGTRTTNSIPISWTNGNGAGRIVVARLNNTTRVAPTTGTVYTANSASFTDVSNSITGTGNVVVYNGTGNNVEVTGLSANTNYIFDIYDYNGTTGTINYSSVLSSTATSTLSAEPSTQASSITYSNITATGMTIGFTTGNGAGRIILVKQGNAVDAIPIDGTSYTGNLAFGSGNQIGTGNFVVRASTATGTATITNLNPNTTYHIAIFEYNGTSGTINYLTSSALIGSATTRPTPASNVSATSRSVNSIGVSWINGNGIGRIVVARTLSAISPTDGTEYTSNSTDINDVLNSITGTGNFVVYNGTGNNVNITGLSASTNYKFDVYEYNGSGAERIYALAGTSATNIFTLNTEPTTAASITGFSNINATGLTINMEKGDGANRLIIAKANSAVNANPVDGESYNAAAFGSGTQIGTGNYVVYSGAAANATITGLNANTTYHFAVYEFNGSGTTINYLTTNTPNANQITLVSAPTTPTNLSFSTVTQSSFNISFTASSGSPTGYLVMRRMGAALTGSPVGGTVYEAGQSIGAAANQIIYVGTDALSNFAQTSLVDNTTYHYAVYAYSGSGSQTNYSLALSGSQTTLTAAVTLPYTQNFESTTNEWLLATTGTNKWAIGSATNNGGTKALYISNDGGATNVYTLNSSQTGTDAVVRIDLTGQTAASLSFDWKSNGELYSGSWVDYGEVYINIGGSDIRLSAAKEFVNTTTFATKNISLTPYVGGVVSLKFRWVNDGSSGNQPPFAIDNISITAGDYPSLTTTTTTSITTNGVTTGGNITNDGGSAISARGVCYGTSPNPTIAGDKTSDGTGTGSFVSTISGLIDNTIYYVRAYATNSTGTSYGNEISFTTSSVSATTANAATSLTTTEFTANWNAVNGASEYKLDVGTASNFGYTSKLSENFSGFTTNNGSTNLSTTLNTYLQTTGWTGDAIYEMIGYTKMGSGSTKGILTTPKIDLSANSGNATLTFDLMKYGSDATLVQVFHTPDGTNYAQVGTDINPPTSMTTQTINITGGTVNSKIRIASKSLSDYRFYLDNFNIVQENPSVLLSSFNNLSVATTSQEVTGLTPNTTYYYRVRAVGGNSTSANSNVVTVLTLPAAPVASAASTVNALNFVANWTLPGTGADSYTLDVATDEDFNNKLEAYNNLTVTGTSQAISGLSRNTTYYYRVKSLNASGASVSNVISVSTGNAITVTGSNESAGSLADCVDCDLVVNQGGHLTVNAYKTFNSVTLKPGAKLTLNNGQTFAPGTFVLESNASATATFVDKRTHANKTNITATVQQHLPAATTRTWWYLASPVTGAASSVFGSNKVGDYSETTRSYSNPFAAPTTLTVGKGYVVKMTATEAANYAFENKTLNTGDISVLLTRTVTETADNAKRGFNLVGNPYPSYLNWELVYAASTNIRSTIWYRTLDKGSMAFYTYNAKSNISVPDSAHGYIPPMQAFWVKVDTDPVSPATVSNGTLKFTNDMRSHDESEDGNPLKAPAADRNLVRLSISNGTLSDEAVIVTHPSASDNYDSYDSEKMANGDANRPEIFSMAGNQELVINGISPLTDSKQIALGVRPGRAGNYTISLTEWRNTGNLEAVLRDNQLGEELILTESSSYSFDTDGSTSTSRFSLLFRAKGSNTGFDHISSDLMIYSTQNTIRVESASLEGNTISIFNALGQPVFSGKAQSNRLEINGLTPAVYMVKVSNQTKMVIVK